MQTTLLGLAIAVILALVAALVGPLLIDWGGYRSMFETQAGHLIGVDVRVTGAIEARLLPSPRLVLHDIAIGKGDDKVDARALGIEFALAPLMRGQWHAAELHLTGATLRLGLDATGRVQAPNIPINFSPDALSIDRLSIEDARIALADAANGGAIVLDKVWFNGEARSLLGPVQRRRRSHDRRRALPVPPQHRTRRRRRRHQGASQCRSGQPSAQRRGRRHARDRQWRAVLRRDVELRAPGRHRHRARRGAGDVKPALAPRRQGQGDGGVGADVAVRVSVRLGGAEHQADRHRRIQVRQGSRASTACCRAGSSTSTAPPPPTAAARRRSRCAHALAALAAAAFRPAIPVRDRHRHRSRHARRQCHRGSAWRSVERRTRLEPRPLRVSRAGLHQSAPERRACGGWSGRRLYRAGGYRDRRSEGACRLGRRPRRAGAKRAAAAAFARRRDGVE